MPSPEVASLARIASHAFGWIYTISWSLSCYPQALLNIRRRSTIGLNFSYPTLNLVGFHAYLISTSFLYASPLIRSQYAARHPHNPEPTVRVNDVAFAAHATFLNLIVWTMFWKWLWGFNQGANGKEWRAGKGTLGIIAGCVVGVACVVILVLVNGRDGGRDPESWAWIDVIYSLGLVKLVITLVKYTPQVMTNYRRQSTMGFSIQQILLDFIGGVLSVLQLVIDSSLQSDWSGLTNNPTKFWLGNFTIFFDLILIVQHYVLYRNSRTVEDIDDLSGEETRLLASDDEEATCRNNDRMMT